ncbi:MAG: hypothetical protein NTX00_02840 [Candidatus Parcubacteria bacterium]|nr:hypothetical protein [Candidatus Parcubacteria bacterium]
MALKNIWHGLILLKVKARNLYLDRKSIEQNTGVQKIKYKLAANVLKDLQIYPFFILRSELTCSRYFAFQIDRGDWLQSRGDYLNKPCSYIDIRCPEIIGQNELYLKIRDKRNFFSVARLKDSKYNEMVNFAERIKMTSDVRDETKGLILKELTGDTQGINIDNFLEKYKLE